MLTKKQLLKIIKAKLKGDPVVQIHTSDKLNIILQLIEELLLNYHNLQDKFIEQSENLNFVLENLNSGLIAIDQQGVIVFCNKKAKDFFEISSEEIINVREFIRNSELFKKIQETIKKSSRYEFDLSVENEIFEIKLCPVMGKIVKLLIFINKVTEIRKIADEKEQFFANASHELNTPLASILGYTELIIKSKLYNDVFLQKIKSQAQKMEMILKDMLEISQLESNTVMKKSKFNLSNMIKALIEDYELKANEKKIKLSYVIENDNKILGDENLIKIAISNLLDNAIKYNKEHGFVEITLKKIDNYMVFSISDTGIGIDKKDLTRITERFFRTESARAIVEHGTGLGLSIVKNIINKSNATFSINSQRGVGTTFIIKFKL